MNINNIPKDIKLKKSGYLKYKIQQIPKITDNKGQSKWLKSKSTFWLTFEVFCCAWACNTCTWTTQLSATPYD